jgi:hypothetical protein
MSIISSVKMDQNVIDYKRDVLPLFQNTCHSNFIRYNLFIMHLDIYYVHIHSKENVCRKVRITSISKRMEY